MQNNLHRALLVCALFVIGTLFSVFSQSDAHIIGHVIDQETGEHIPYATLKIKDKNVGAITDASGHYEIKNMPVGRYVLEASFMGYTSKSHSVDVRKGKTLEVHFELVTDNQILDEVVVSSNRTETKRRESAAIVNVVNTKLFDRVAANNVSEALNFQTGLRVEQSCSNCGVPQLRINGLEGQYSQILLDSRPIFSSLSTVYGLEQLPAGMVERVEVIRGGGSALFGSNAIAGVVNIITKEPMSNSFSLSNRSSILGNVFDQSTTLNGSLITSDFKTGVYIFSMIRDRQAYDRDADGFSDIPQLNSETLGFRGFHRFTDLSRLTMEYHHIREFRRGGNVLDRPAHEADVAEQLRHGINGGSIKYDLYSDDYQHQMNVYASAQHINRDSYFGTMKDLNAYGETTDMTALAGGQYIWNAKRLWFMPAQLVVGAEYSYNNLHDQQLGYDRDRKQISKTMGGYFQNEWKNHRWSFLLGGRLEKHNLIATPIFSPRVNVRFTPHKEWALRLSYASGYRAPQAYEEDLHVGAVGGQVSLIELAEGLRPEFSNSISGSVDWTKRLDSWGQVSFLAEGFYTKLSDLFTLVEKGVDANGNMLLERRNALGAMVAGVNLEAKFDHLQLFSFQVGMTAQKSLHDEPYAWSDDPSVVAGRKMFRTPDLYGYGSFSYNVNRRWSIATTINVTGTMQVPHFAGFVVQDKVTTTPVFTEWGVKTNYQLPLSKQLRLDLELGVKNVLDQFQPDLDRGVMRDAKYIYGPSAPRTCYVGVKLFL